MRARVHARSRARKHSHSHAHMCIRRQEVGPSHPRKLGLSARRIIDLNSEVFQGLDEVHKFTAGSRVWGGERRRGIRR